MSEISRRDVLKHVALCALAGGVSFAQAQHVHHAAAQAAQASGGTYKPKALTAAEYATLRRLCGLIVPGSLEGGAPEFIDLLASNNKDLLAIYTGGIAWLDDQMKARYQAPFASARPADQTSMLDLISRRENEAPELGAGIRFFDWVRKMTVDAYYTSKPGIGELGFQGNVGMAKFEVPVEAIEYALKRSGL